MKNEIGRKLTSLTIMAIMFAGGMTIAAPSFMPGVFADFSVTDGELSVSSEFIQGAAILEIVVNDPDMSATDVDLASGVSVIIGGSSYEMTQGANGKWYLYVVDQSISKAMDGDDNGLEYGYHCDTGLGVSANASALIVPSGTDVWAAALTTSGETTAQAGSCLDIDNMIGTLDDATATVARDDLTAAVLQDAPTLSDHDDAATDLGQQGHKLNASGYGSWPYILSIELSTDNIIEYGSDMINVEFGNTDDETALNIVNNNPASYAELHLTLTDPALNIDPTTADTWIFDLDAAASATSVIFGNNGTNNALSPAELGEMQCEDNCRLYSDVVTTLVGGTNGYDDVSMIESSENSGFFESFDLNGESQIEIVAEAGGDKKTVFSYGGNNQDIIITYNDATIEFGGVDGTWDPTEVATFTIVDPEANKNPTEVDELEIGDETDVIPTIKMGSPKTLAGGANACLQGGTEGQNSNLCDGGSTLTYGIK